LSECTNKRANAGQLTAPAAKKQQSQQDVQPIDLCDDDDYDSTPAATVAPHTSDPQATDSTLQQQQQYEQLRAGRDAEQQHEQADEPRTQQEQQQAPKQAHDQLQQHAEAAMEVDDGPAVLSLPAPASKPASQAATPAGSPAGMPAPAAAAAEREPATPAGALLSAAGTQATAPSALKSTGGKAAAEVLLTPEQRKQLLEDCQQVRSGRADTTAPRRE
jgi:hypothetical protein